MILIQIRGDIDVLIGIRSVQGTGADDVTQVQVSGIRDHAFPEKAEHDASPVIFMDHGPAGFNDPAGSPPQR